MAEPSQEQSERAGSEDSFLRAVIERVNDGFVALDIDWRYTYVNQTAAVLLQRESPQDLIGRHIWSEFPEAVGLPFHQAYYRALETQQPVVLEEFFLPWSKWFENRIFPSPEGLTIYFTDITARKEEEARVKRDAAFHENENRLLGMLARGQSPGEVLAQATTSVELHCAGAVCSIVVQESDGVAVHAGAQSANRLAGVLRAVRRLARDFGLSPVGPSAEDARPTFITDLEFVEQPASAREVAREHGLHAWWSHPILAEEGQALGFVAVAHPARREPSSFERRLLNRISQIAGIAIERSRLEAEREQAEGLLREREMRLSSIYETVGDIIFQLAVEGEGRYRFTSVNRAFLETTGLDEQQVVGRALEDVLPEPAVRLVKARYAKAIRSKSVVSWEETSDYPSGRLTGEVSVAPLFDENGHCTHLVGAIHDITKFKRLEQELRTLNADLEERVRERTAELAVQMERAQESDRLKSAFLATMSHELRTPLNSILGFAGILLQELAGPLNEEQKKQLGMARTSARHLLDLINDVLDLSRIEAGQMELRPAAFDIRAAVESALVLAAPLAEAKGLNLGVSIEPGIPPIVSDRRRVEQILINLLNNAVKFTESGDVELSVRRSDGLLVLTVRDTGIGIDPQHLDILFKPFQQIDSGTGRVHEGTGLGLSICKQLAELLGGEIRVASARGAGSEFSLVLPTGDRSKWRAS